MFTEMLPLDGLTGHFRTLSTLEHDVYDSEWNHHTEELEIIANIYTNYNKYDYYSTRINKPISVQRSGPWT